MDPSLFFGRSRVTRQTLKQKQVSPSKNKLSDEVSSDSQKKSVATTAKGRKAKIVVAGKENDVIEVNASKSTAKAGKRTVKKNNAENVKQNDVTSKLPTKTRKVQFNKVEENLTKEAVASGPVYRNVRRSDVIGDPLDEYDFPVDDNASPPKKKKNVRKTNATKNSDKWYGTVKWEPSKRPISLKPKPAAKKKVKAPDAGTTSKQKEENEVTKTMSSKEPRRVVEESQKAVPHDSTSLPDCTSLTFSTDDHFTSTPVAPQAISGKTGPSISVVTTTPTARKHAATVLQSALPNFKKRTIEIDQSCSIAQPSSPAMIHDVSIATPRSTSNVTCIASRNVARSATSSSRVRSAQVLAASTPLMVRSICVRESPSFREAEPTPEHCQNSSAALPEAHSNDLSVTTPSPVSAQATRSKAAAKIQSSPIVDFTAPLLSPAAISPCNISDSPAMPSWSQPNESCDKNLSGLFDDIPRTSVIPTRMFSTKRGTIFVPVAENVTKRKMPKLSPLKEQGASRPATIKFSVPESPSGLDNCFGFSDEDPTFIPQAVSRPQQGVKILTHAKEQNSGKPRLTIQEVQSILRGQSKLASPVSATRSVQTKLTDFINSSSTPARVVPQPNAVVLTPTPVPLFGEELLNKDLPSPFLQPSRRSYDRFRPVKRIACGDEVHSGDEEEDTIAESFMPTAAPAAKKKSKAYKKKKKPQDIQLDSWANQLASHFDEVEEVELQLE